MRYIFRDIFRDIFGDISGDTFRAIFKDIFEDLFRAAGPGSQRTRRVRSLSNAGALDPARFGGPRAWGLGHIGPHGPEGTDNFSTDYFSTDYFSTDYFRTD